MQNGALFHNTPGESEFDRWLQVSTENAQVLTNPISSRFVGNSSTILLCPSGPLFIESAS
jgi:hypothetical protein